MPRGLDEENVLTQGIAYSICPVSLSSTFPSSDNRTLNAHGPERVTVRFAPSEFHTIELPFPRLA